MLTTEQPIELVTPSAITAIEELLRDLKVKARSLSRQEAKYLVKAYYEIQHYRIKAANNISAAKKEERDSNEVLIWIARQFEILEGNIKKVLDEFSNAHEAGIWAKSQYGIGPVLAAGLLAHIDVNKAQTHGDVWHHAGLIPGLKKEKGTKLSWNAELKVLTWKIGESFFMFHKRPECFYGQLMAKRKAEYTAKNEAGDYAETAAQILIEKKYNKSTEAYKAYSEGKLPLAHVHARARRFAVKIFLSHFFEIEYKAVHGKEPPKPYAMAVLNHAHYIAPPMPPEKPKKTKTKTTGSVKTDAA